MKQYNWQFLQALANVLAPAAVVTQLSDRMEVKNDGTLVGYITVNEYDQWYATRVETKLGGWKKTAYLEEQVNGPFPNPSLAIRRLFNIDNAPLVQVREGVSAGEQESSFMNATLQDAGEATSFSVATKLEIPEYVISKGEAAIAGYISGALGRASSSVSGLSFEVEIGPTEDPED